MNFRKLLLNMYPRSWRAEYGEEFAGILATRRLTPAIVLDVLGGAVRQRLTRTEPWILCGAALSLWTVLLPFFAFPTEVGIMLFWAAGLLLIGGLGARTRSMPAVLKAACAGQLGFCGLYLLAVLRMGSRPFLGHTIHFWFAKTMALNLAACLIFGLAGTAFARWKIARR